MYHRDLKKENKGRKIKADIKEIKYNASE